jgi:predicted AAA+ superfamily ATPase
MEKFDTTQARIITLDKDASLKTDRGEVPAISFWKWALSKA